MWGWLRRLLARRTGEQPARIYGADWYSDMDRRCLAGRRAERLLGELLPVSAGGGVTTIPSRLADELSYQLLNRVSVHWRGRYLGFVCSTTVIADLPYQDWLLQHILLLRYDERRVWELGNWFSEHPAFGWRAWSDSTRLDPEELIKHLRREERLFCG